MKIYIINFIILKKISQFRNDIDNLEEKYKNCR